MSKLSHSNDKTMNMIERNNRQRRNEMEAITHDEWYAALNRISQLRAAMEDIIKEATTTIDGIVYVPSGYQKVVSIARNALKEEPSHDRP